MVAYQAAQNDQVGKHTPLENPSVRENHLAKQPGVQVPIFARFCCSCLTPQMLSNLSFPYRKETLRCVEYPPF